MFKQLIQLGITWWILTLLGVTTLLGLGGCNVDGKGNWEIWVKTGYGMTFQEDAPGDGQPATTNVQPFTEALGSVAELWKDPAQDDTNPPPGG